MPQLTAKRAPRRQVLDVEHHMETWRTYWSRCSTERATRADREATSTRHALLEHFARLPESFDEMPTWINDLNKIGDFETDPSRLAWLPERNAALNSNGLYSGHDGGYFHITRSKLNRDTGKHSTSTIRMECSRRAMRWHEKMHDAAFQEHLASKESWHSVTGLYAVCQRYHFVEQAAQFALGLHLPGQARFIMSYALSEIENDYASKSVSETGVGRMVWHIN